MMLGWPFFFFLRCVTDTKPVVYQYIEVPEYVDGCKALGLVNKIPCGEFLSLMSQFWTSMIVSRL